MAQAIEYAAHGHRRAEEWISASHASLESESSRSMAAVMREGDPDRWWTDFVANYRISGGPDSRSLRPADGSA
jgi:hypothetical protein